MCHTAVKYTGSTTNLITYLRRWHGISTVEVSTTIPASSALSSDSAKAGTNGEQSFFNAPLANSLTRSQKITDPVAFFICKYLQPYSVTENEGFYYFLHVLEPRYKIPSRKLLTEKEIPALYEKVNLDIAQSLTEAKRVAITVDGWTSWATDPYITVTVHCIDDDWVSQNHILQTRMLMEAHTGSNLAALLQDICSEWKLTDKNQALVTDNTKNMILAGAGAELDPHVQCIAHTLNFASQKALKVDKVSDLLMKMTKMATFFHKSPKATEIPREMQTQLHLLNHKLIPDVSTRWNSSLEMLERFW